MAMEEKGTLRKIDFTLESDFELTQYAIKTVTVLEEETDIEEGTCSGFIIFNQNPTEIKAPIFMFSPDIKGISPNYTKGKDCLVYNNENYPSIKILVQIAIADGNLVLLAYSSTTTITIPAGNYTVYIVRR